MQLQESGEMYLETILILHNINKKVRSLDVAEYMGFSKPSISRAMGILKENNYIIIDEDGYITLTEKGHAIADKIYERHLIVTTLLKNIGVSAQQAEEDACKIEHDLSDETFNAIKAHLSHFDKT